MKKKQCQLLVDRVVAITAAIMTELMKADPATLARRENSVVSLRGYVQILGHDCVCSNLLVHCEAYKHS